MIASHETLTNPKFWVSYLCSSFGQIGEPPEPEKIFDIFGLDEQDAIRWWQDFTGWYEGIFEDSDGEVDDPSTLIFEFRRGTTLSIEFHAGDTYYHLHGPDSSSELIANIGPHWVLPALRWQEAVALSRATELESGEPPRSLSSLVLLILLPCVWLTEGDDVEHARDCVTKAWLESGLVGSREAGILSQTWVDAIDVRNEYRWWQNGEEGWVTNAGWSVRHVEKPVADVCRLNGLLLRAADS